MRLGWLLWCLGRRGSEVNLLTVARGNIGWLKKHLPSALFVVSSYNSDLRWFKTWGTGGGSWEVSWFWQIFKRVFDQHTEELEKDIDRGRARKGAFELLQHINALAGWKWPFCETALVERLRDFKKKMCGVWQYQSILLKYNSPEQLFYIYGVGMTL